ncbi:lipopolysaccharide kinase InaA family protein [Flavobacterium sp. '19STA2R22 D10 B1']|uniref:lipopolysaccharide kinase InaA family protein n=1 Tax=Flavobacterium aerium TaxID=3037261 RepID=UPI00278BE047|nr:lipopolysaccharide kinase InaA family protein [Flavobacterium sp. '19STA2R22 D10 B1']
MTICNANYTIIEIQNIIDNFESNPSIFVKGDRNVIKLAKIKEETINIKSFKIPIILNQFIYKYFRKSKARRSYEYATALLKNGIKTPMPIAYSEEFNWIGLQHSFYISEHLTTELTYRELVTNRNYPDRDTILKQFVQFSFQLHEKGIEFLDHSPGNTLIKKIGEGQYEFYLVDLNRMNFHESMDFDMRMKNLSHLTPDKDMVYEMSEEYARLYQKPVDEVFEKMWHYTHSFSVRFDRKRRMKKKLKFWKK